MDYDAIVIGTGFGASVAVSRLAESGKRVRYTVVNDERTLLYLVNQGVVTLHTGSSRLPEVTRPEMDEGNPELVEAVYAALKSVRDPEIPVNLVDLGLIYEVAARKDGLVYIEMTLTTPACPVAGSLPAQLQIISLLRQHRADPEAADAVGRTPRDAVRNEAILRALSEAP